MTPNEVFVLVIIFWSAAVARAFFLLSSRQDIHWKQVLPSIEDPVEKRHARALGELVRLRLRLVPDPETTSAGPESQHLRSVISHILFILLACIAWWQLAPTFRIGPLTVPVWFILPAWGILMALRLLILSSEGMVLDVDHLRGVALTGPDNESNAKILVNAAYHDVENQRLAPARTKLECALAICDTLATAHSEYALVLLKLGRAGAARQHILRSIELDPSNPKFWAALSNWHFLQSQYEEAMRCIAYAELLNPSYPSIPVAKAHIAHATGASDEQVRNYQRQARQLYNSRGTRADGARLELGDIDRFVFVKPQTTARTGCASLLALLGGVLIMGALLMLL